MKIRWFAPQNATYFRVFANQFDNFAHSGANQLVRGNVRVIFISMPCQQSDCTLAASLVSCQHRTDGTTQVTRQIDSDSRWGGGVRLASGRAAAAASKATKPRASDTTGRAWPVYWTLNCAHCWWKSQWRRLTMWLQTQSPLTLQKVILTLTLKTSGALSWRSNSKSYYFTLAATGSQQG